MDVLNKLLPRKKPRIDYISQLPEDIYTVIASFVDVYTLMQLSLTCKSIHNKLKNHYIWLCKFQEVGLNRKEVLQNFMQKAELKLFNSENLREIMNISKESLISKDKRICEYIKLLYETCINFAKLGYQGFYFGCEYYVRCGSKKPFYYYDSKMSENARSSLKIDEKNIKIITDEIECFAKKSYEMLQYIRQNSSVRVVGQYLTKKGLSYSIQADTTVGPKERRNTKGKCNALMRREFDIKFMIHW